MALTHITLRYPFTNDRITTIVAIMCGHYIQRSAYLYER